MRKAALSLLFLLSTAPLDAAWSVFSARGNTYYRNSYKNDPSQVSTTSRNKWYYDSTGRPDYASDNATVTAALTRALASWNGVSGSLWRFDTAVTVHSGSHSWDDGIHDFYWKNEPGTMLAVTELYSSSGARGDGYRGDGADIYFNAGAMVPFQFGTTGVAGHVSFENVARHELGHSLGLAHSDNDADVMSATSIPGVGSASLTSSDIAADQYLYASVFTANGETLPTSLKQGTAGTFRFYLQLSDNRPPASTAYYLDISVEGPANVSIAGQSTGWGTGYPAYYPRNSAIYNYQGNTFSSASPLVSGRLTNPTPGQKYWIDVSITPTDSQGTITIFYRGNYIVETSDMGFAEGYNCTTGCASMAWGANYRAFGEIRPRNATDAGGNYVDQQGFPAYRANVTITSGATVNVNAKNDGVAWVGQLASIIDGPGGLSGAVVPLSFTGPAGTYSVRYVNGGPPGATLISITPSSSQTVANNGTITFTLNFATTTCLASTLNGPSALATCNPPPAPTGLNATTVSAIEVDLSWTDNASIETGFKIERKTGTSGTYSQIATVGSNVTTYKDTTAACGNQYLYRVRATNGVDSAYSNEATATTNACAASTPNPPSGMSAVALSSSSIKVSWTDNSNNEASFLVYRWNGATWVQIGTVGANVTTYTDTGLQSSTTYFHIACSQNSAGTNCPGTYSTATTQSSSTVTTPTAPSGMSAVALSSSSIKVSWTDNSNNEASFLVYRWDGSNWVQIGAVGANVTTYTDTGLQPSTTYFHTVCAQNSAGTNCASTYSTATTQSTFTVPAAPSGLSATPLSSSSIKVFWADNSSNETAFIVYRWNGTTWVQIATVGANVTSYTNSGLQSSTTYFHTVCAQNSVGTNCASTYSTATTY
jgi:archaellum component FlaG (FlaF/FlaG flagellin family)